MENNNNNLDNLFKQATNQQDFIATDADWQKAAALINNKKRSKKLLLWWWSLGCVALLALGTTFIIYFSTKNNNTYNTQQHTNSTYNTAITTSTNNKQLTNKQLITETVSITNNANNSTNTTTAQKVEKTTSPALIKAANNNPLNTASTNTLHNQISTPIANKRTPKASNKINKYWHNSNSNPLLAHNTNNNEPTNTNTSIAPEELTPMPLEANNKLSLAYITNWYANFMAHINNKQYAYLEPTVLKIPSLLLAPKQRNKLLLVAGIPIINNIVTTPVTKASLFNSVGYLGVGATINLTPKLYLYTALQANLLGDADLQQKFTDKNYDFGSTAQYKILHNKKILFAQLPVLLNYRLNNKHSLGLGAQGAYLITALGTITTEGEATQKAIGYTSAYNTLAASAVTSYNYQIAKQLLINATVTCAVTSIVKPQQGIYYNRNPYSVSVGVGYQLFNLNK